MMFTFGSLDPKEQEVLARINQMRKDLRYATGEPRRWSGPLRRQVFARAIQGSNSIEGYNVTLDDAVAAADNEEPLDAGDETWLAVTGYRKAMTYILQMARDEHFEFSSALLKSLHFMMIDHDLSKSPGMWRPGYIAVRNEATGKIVYEGPDADLVPDLMDELVASLRSTNDLPPLIRAATAHLNLVMIHPFRDGNGRMGRALQTLVLAREGMLDPVFSSIEEYLGRNTIDYYNVLAEVGQGSWHPGNDCRPWIRFCLKAHFHQQQTHLRRIRRIERVYVRLDEMVRIERHLPERMAIALLDAAFGMRVRNAGYRKMADISLNLASRDLKTLADNGLLIPKGERRGRYYVATDEITAFYEAERRREPRSEEDPFSSQDLFLPGLVFD